MDQTFILRPMSQRFDLKPGETVTGSVTITNPADSTKDFKYVTSITPYSVVDSNNTADLGSKNGHTLITDWITIAEPTGTIAPNSSKIVNFTITVPNDAPPGGQYATIAVSSSPDSKENNGVAVDSILELASIIYGKVEGQVVRDVAILGNDVPGFTFTVPVEVTADLQNKGNIHEDATFSLNVTNVFTGEQIYPTANDKATYTELVMPESTRHVTRKISNLPSVGAVKVNQTIYFNGEYSTMEKTVFICPVWLLLTAIIVIGGLITFITVKLRRHFRRKKSVTFD